MNCLKRGAAFSLALLMAFSLSACQKPGAGPEPEPSASNAPAPTPTPTPDPEEAVRTYWSEDQLTQAWGPNQVVEHLFFHPVIAYPEFTFSSAVPENRQRGLVDWMLTADEFKKILDELYRRDYILVNMCDVWSEYTTESGESRMQRNTLMLPEGKKPLVLSFDDVNYYEYMLAEGFTSKLVLGEDGDIWAECTDPNTKETFLTQDLDATPILDQFVRAHPDFSLNGAKGCFSLTGHINLDSSKVDLDWVKRDTVRWAEEVGSLVGPTNILFYPHGARPDGDDWHQTGPKLQYLQSQGFRIFASVGVNSFSYIKDDLSAVICDRLHPDGTTLRYGGHHYTQFYDVRDIMDTVHRPDYGNNWAEKASILDQIQKPGA